MSSGTAPLCRTQLCSGISNCNYLLQAALIWFFVPRNLRHLSCDWCVPAFDYMCKMYICKDMRLLCLVVILSGTLTDSKENNGSIGQGTNTSKLNIFSSYQGQIRNAFEMRETSHFRIVNGSRAKTGEFRCLVSLQWTDEKNCGHQSKPCHQCGGALLTRTGIFLSTTFALNSDFLVHFATIYWLRRWQKSN